MTFYAFIIINIITFVVYGLDKLKAVNHWGVPAMIIVQALVTVYVWK